MNRQKTTAAHSSHRPLLQRRGWALAGYLLVLAAALVPRLLDLGRFITDDEANFWLRRSDVFLNALRSGDYLQTAITTHPGVTTMWLGAGGVLLRGWLDPASFPALLALMRLPVVLTHAAVLLLGYALLRRMLPGAPALLAALLWALDPFLIGYGRLLHTDALAGSFAMLSLLAACVYWNHSPRWRWLALSGVSAGLAFLSKSPALALAPAVGLLALFSDTRHKTRDTSGALKSRVLCLVSRASPALAWAALAALTAFALWPALWVNPLAAYRQVQLGVLAEGAQPHMLGNFFLGRQDDAPGLLFYPVALPLRLTPWTLAGLLICALPWVWFRRPAPQRRSLAGLAGFALLFLAAMSLFPKKFDRYLVPIFPALDVLAAVGLLGAVGLVKHFLGAPWLRTKSQEPRTGAASVRGSRFAVLRLPWLRRAWAALIVLAALLNVAWWQPYQIIAFNQLLGGAPAGARTFFMGWGEGLEQVADWLNAQPDITGTRVIALRVTSLNPFLREGGQADFPKGDQLRERSGYVVVYLPQVQAGRPGPPFDRFYGRHAPLHVVRLKGVDVAWIYRAPPAVAAQRGAGFGPDIRLYGLDQAGEWQRGQTVRLRLVWATSALPRQDYWLFAHLVGPDGQAPVRLDLPLPTSQWAPAQYAASELPVTLPADLPAGEYRLLVGLYTLESGQRLPLTPATPAEAAADSPDALVLERFVLR